MKTLLVISISILAIASTCFALPDAEDCKRASESGIVLYDCSNHELIIFNENIVIIYNNPDISKHKHKEKHICKDEDTCIIKYKDNHIQGKGKR